MIFKQNLSSIYAGGALKPSNVEGLWVNVTCAWFRPEVGFLNHENRFLRFAQFVSRNMVPACIAASVPPLPCNVCVTGRLQHGVALPGEKWGAENLEISLLFFSQEARSK
ncbi:unnamed protein product [Arabidopsis halleri]